MALKPKDAPELGQFDWEDPFRLNDQLTEVYASIDALIDYALAHLDLDPRNADWTRNQIFALFRLDSYPGPKTTTSAASVSDVVQDIVGSRSQAP